MKPGPIHSCQNLLPGRKLTMAELSLVLDLAVTQKRNTKMQQFIG